MDKLNKPKKGNSKFKKIVATGLAVTSVVTAASTIKNHQGNREKNDTRYTIESGDTLYDISNRHYGDGDRYNEIADYNNIENPDYIKAGDTINLPNDKKEDPRFKHAKLIDYTVKEGDSMTAICERFYNDGSLSMANRLARFNKMEDVNSLQIGQELKIPSLEELMNINAYLYDYEYDQMMKK